MADKTWFIASFPSPLIFRYLLPLNNAKRLAMTGAFKTKQDKGNRMLEEVFMLTPVYPFLML